MLGAGLLCLSSCGGQTQTEQTPAVDKSSAKNQVIETIMTRRSVRKYLPQPVNRDTMQMILDCGIHAPNGQNKQSWAVRVVDNPEFINGITEVYKKLNPKMAEDPGFKNMFRNAPTVVFIANDTSYDMSQIDCGLLGENMILSAWSMGIGSCCLGSPIRFMKTEPQVADYLKRLNIPEGYELLYCIAFGYPDESPDRLWLLPQERLSYSNNQPVKFRYPPNIVLIYRRHGCIQILCILQIGRAHV